MKQPVGGFDVDTDDLAANLRELADGIDNGDVHVTGGYEGESIMVEDATEFKFELSFIASSDSYGEFFNHGDGE